MKTSNLGKLFRSQKGFNDTFAMIPLNRFFDSKLHVWSVLHVNPLKERSQIPLWDFWISNFSRNFEIFYLGKYLSKNNFKHSVLKLRIYTFWIYHRNLLCLILYCFTKELRTTGCFGKSENISTSNAAKTTWKWGQVIMIIPEVKSMDLQLSNGVSTNTTR